MHSLSCSFWRALRISPTSSRLWELKRRDWFKAVLDITSPFLYPPSTCFLCSPRAGFGTFSGQVSVCLEAASPCWAAWPGKHREEQGWLLGPSVNQPWDPLPNTQPCQHKASAGGGAGPHLHFPCALCGEASSTCLFWEN